MKKRSKYILLAMIIMLGIFFANMDGRHSSSYVENHPYIDNEFISEVLLFDPVYAHDEELADAMKALSIMDEDNEEANIHLSTISEVTQIPLSLVIEDWHTVLEIKALRLKEPRDLSLVMENHWASKAQLVSGKIVGHYFDIDPWAGALLNETGGTIGPGGGFGTYIFFVPFHNITVVNSHAVFHDAYGYLYNFHDYMGPGYWYAYGLNEIPAGFVSTQNPLSGHVAGILEQTKYHEVTLTDDVFSTVSFFMTPWYEHMGKIMVSLANDFEVFTFVKERLDHLSSIQNTVKMPLGYEKDPSIDSPYLN